MSPDDTVGGWLPLLLTTLLSAALTYAWIQVAPRLRALDIPGQRRLHVTPTPRGGGIAIVLSMTAGVLWLGKIDVAFLIGLWGVALLGLLDDFIGVSARHKLLGQILVLGIWAVLLSPNLAWAIVILALGLWAVNVWNFMDGSNGLIASQALCFAGAVVWLVDDGDTTLHASVMGAAILGFLPFNSPKARVFLGDCGSYALGFLVIHGSLLQADRSPEHGDAHVIAIAIAATMPIWVDSALTLAVRAWQGKDVASGHRSHLYQWLIRRGMSHVAVMLLYITWAIMASFALHRWSGLGLTAGLMMGALAYFMLKGMMTIRR